MYMPPLVVEARYISGSAFCTFILHKVVRFVVKMKCVELYAVLVSLVPRPSHVFNVARESVPDFLRATLKNMGRPGYEASVGCL